MAVRTALMVGVVVSLLAALPVGVSADAGAAEYSYLIGTGLLCGLAQDACPAVARADNGDTIEVTGEGTLRLHPKGVSGMGTLVHRDASGKVVGLGEWHATELLSFKSYGPGTPQGLPPNFFGGIAKIRVHLAPANMPEPGFMGIMQVDCVIGNYPAGAVEGVRLAIQDTPFNFNKEVSGFTLFLAEE